MAANPADLDHSSALRSHFPYRSDRITTRGQIAPPRAALKMQR